MPDATEPLRHELQIAAPPEVVFAYFTDPGRMVEWMGVGALLDPRPGGALRIDANGRDVVVGEYVELDPPRRLVFTWGFDGGTVVHFEHAGWQDEQAHGEMAMCGYTWAMIIDRLAAQASTGERAPYFRAGAPLPR